MQAYLNLTFLNRFSMTASNTHDLHSKLLTCYALAFEGKLTGRKSLVRMNRVSGYSSLHLISSNSSAIFDLLFHVPSDGRIGGAPGPGSVGVWRAQGAWSLLLLRWLDLRGEHRVALLLSSIRGVGERASIL